MAPQRYSIPSHHETWLGELALDFVAATGICLSTNTMDAPTWNLRHMTSIFSAMIRRISQFANDQQVTPGTKVKTSNMIGIGISRAIEGISRRARLMCPSYVHQTWVHIQGQRTVGLSLDFDVRPPSTDLKVWEDIDDAMANRPELTFRNRIRERVGLSLDHKTAKDDNTWTQRIQEYNDGGLGHQIQLVENIHLPDEITTQWRTIFPTIRCVTCLNCNPDILWRFRDLGGLLTKECPSNQARKRKPKRTSSARRPVEDDTTNSSKRRPRNSGGPQQPQRKRR